MASANWLVIALVLLVVLATGCSLVFAPPAPAATPVPALSPAAPTTGALPPSGAVAVGDKDNGTQIKMGKGQTLVVSLESTPGTGYSWDLGEAMTLLQQDGDPEFKSASAMPGAPATQIMRFKAVASGQGTLKLVYRRPWEKNVDPIKTFNLQVTVQ